MSSSKRISRLCLNDKRKTGSECHCIVVQNEVNTEVAVPPKKVICAPLHQYVYFYDDHHHLTLF